MDVKEIDREGPTGSVADYYKRGNTGIVYNSCATISFSRRNLLHEVSCRKRSGGKQQVYIFD
jgi:hypothetical protein